MDKTERQIKALTALEIDRLYQQEKDRSLNVYDVAVGKHLQSYLKQPVLKASWFLSRTTTLKIQ